MNKKTKKILIIAGIFLGLALIGSMLPDENNSATAEPVTTKTAPKRAKIDRTKAYVIAKQFAKNHLGSADYGWGDDGFTDWGNGDYHITGIADIPGRRIRWTIELHYNGGEWNNVRNWTEKGFVTN